MRTTIENEGRGVRIRRSDGESVLVEDVGRCYRIYRPDGSVNVSKNIGAWSDFVKIVRRWFRNDKLPIMDYHC